MRTVGLVDDGNSTTALCAPVWRQQSFQTARKVAWDVGIAKLDRHAARESTARLFEGQYSLHPQLEIAGEIVGLHLALDNHHIIYLTLVFFAFKNLGEHRCFDASRAIVDHDDTHWRASTTAHRTH